MFGNTDSTDPKPQEEGIDYYIQEYPNIFEEIHFKSLHDYKPYVLLEKAPLRRDLNPFRFILTQAGIVTMTGDPSSIWEINGKQRNVLEIVNDFSNTQQDYLNSNGRIRDYYLHTPGEEKIKLSFTPYAAEIKDSHLILALEDIHRYDNIGNTPVE